MTVSRAVGERSLNMQGIFNTPCGLPHYVRSCQR